MTGLFATLCLTSVVGIAQAAGGLSDPLIVSDAPPQYLDGEGWALTSTGGINVQALVPGDLLTDLQRAQVIGDPLYELNFQSTLWNEGNFSYTRVFDLAPSILSAQQEVDLVFDSIKLVAEVYLNGNYIGYTADQFLRYSFPVMKLLKPSGNTLKVLFTPANDPRGAAGRFMACSGGWVRTFKISQLKQHSAVVRERRKFETPL